MAIIMPQELPGEDLQRIAAFMNSDGQMDVPDDLTARGTAVLEIITTDERPTFRYVTVGRFILHAEEDEKGTKVPTKEGQGVNYSDVLYDENGRTGKWGVVVEDYDAPEDAFLVGVPL